MSFTLVERFKIRDPIIRVKKEEAKGCFLYNFREGGFSTDLFTKWLDGKLMDVYEFDGHFGRVLKCPWCGNRECDIIEHGKVLEDINTVKLTNRAYQLLLRYIRNMNYDALLFLMRRSCQFCIDPVVKGRVGKCAIPESSRNKPRSINLLNLQFPGFNAKKYSKEAVAVVYKRVQITTI